MTRDLIVATGNPGKLREIREILAGLPVTLSCLADHWDPVPAIPETGATFEENARQKAQWVYGQTGVWTLADDSGLEVDALGGAPGVHSARFAGMHGDNGANNERLLRELADVPLSRRSARFRCVMVLMTAKDAWYTADGACEGRIIEAPRGQEGFGYDPLFVPEGFTATFAELASAQKHAISHRGKALASLRRYLDELERSGSGSR